jgi:hypothetical protein
MIKGSEGCNVHASGSDISLHIHYLYLKIVTNNVNVESKGQSYILQDVIVMSRQDANTIRKKMEKMT